MPVSSWLARWQGVTETQRTQRAPLSVFPGPEFDEPQRTRATEASIASGFPSLCGSISWHQVGTSDSCESPVALCLPASRREAPIPNAGWPVGNLRRSHRKAEEAPGQRAHHASEPDRVPRGRRELRALRLHLRLEAPGPRWLRVPAVREPPPHAVAPRGVSPPCILAAASLQGAGCGGKRDNPQDEAWRVTARTLRGSSPLAARPPPRKRRGHARCTAGPYASQAQPTSAFSGPRRSNPSPVRANWQ